MGAQECLTDESLVNFNLIKIKPVKLFRVHCFIDCSSFP